jgi:hypothetical protein
MAGFCHKPYSTVNYQRLNSGAISPVIGDHFEKLETQSAGATIFIASNCCNESYGKSDQAKRPGVTGRVTDFITTES